MVIANVITVDGGVSVVGDREGWLASPFWRAPPEELAVVVDVTLRATICCCGTSLDSLMIPLTTCSPACIGILLRRFEPNNFKKSTQ